MCVSQSTLGSIETSQGDEARIVLEISIERVI